MCVETLNHLLQTAHKKAKLSQWRRKLYASLHHKKIVSLAALLITVMFLWKSFNMGAWIRWNLANIWLMQALHTANYPTAFARSQQAIDIYKLFPDRPQTPAYLLLAYKLYWKSASNLGIENIALAAYYDGHSMSNSYKDPLSCQPTQSRLEAEEFEGVALGTMSVPRWVDGHLIALLFSSSPISQTVCLAEAGLYQIQVTARHDIPAPIDIEVGWDGWPAGILRYARGDQTWSDQTLMVASPSGWHTLSLSFTNDFFNPTTGYGRDARVDYVEIKLLARNLSK